MNCPEPQCALDFPGGITAYIKFKEMRRLLEQGLDIKQAAAILGINDRVARRRFNKAIGRE